MKGLALLVAAVLLAGCASAQQAGSSRQRTRHSSGQPIVGSASASVRSIPSPPPPARSTPPRVPGRGRLTAASAGGHLVMHVGMRRTVYLVDATDYWGPIRAASPNVVGVRQSGGYAARRPLTAVLTALRPGTTTLVSTTDNACFHASPPCMRPQREWQLTVTVRR